MGTSNHLKDLLIGLLKRNPRERLDFGKQLLHLCLIYCYKNTKLVPGNLKVNCKANMYEKVLFFSKNDGII